MKQSHVQVLVVDDNTDTVTATLKYLEVFGYRARGADSGASALAEASARPPDVVVLDLGLPDMDGLALLQRLREAAGAKPPAFIAMSGRCDEATRQQATAAGIVAYLVKPVAPDALVASIAACGARGGTAQETR